MRGVDWCRNMHLASIHVHGVAASKGPQTWSVGSVFSRLTTMTAGERVQGDALVFKVQRVPRS